MNGMLDPLNYIIVVMMSCPLYLFPKLATMLLFLSSDSLLYMAEVTCPYIDCVREKCFTTKNGCIVIHPLKAKTPKINNITPTLEYSTLNPETNSTCGVKLCNGNFDVG